MRFKGNPLTTNTLYRTVCRGKYISVYLTDDGKARKYQYQMEAKMQWKKPVLEGDLTVTIDLYFKDKRRRDWDNFNKIVMDSLEGICFKDDSQIQEAVVRKHIDKEIPRIEIEIYENL